MLIDGLFDSVIPVQNVVSFNIVKSERTAVSFVYLVLVLQKFRISKIQSS